MLIVNAAGDTIARLTGTNNVGHQSRVVESLKPSSGEVRSPAAGAVAAVVVVVALAGVAAIEGPVNVAGFPPGFNPRPAEVNAPPDTTGSPTAQARELAAGRGGRGGRGGGGGGGGGGFGRGNSQAVETGDYRVVLDVGGQKQTQVLRVVRVGPGMFPCLCRIRIRSRTNKSSRGFTENCYRQIGVRLQLPSNWSLTAIALVVFPSALLSHLRDKALGVIQRDLRARPVEHFVERVVRPRNLQVRDWSPASAQRLDENRTVLRLDDVISSAVYRAASAAAESCPRECA